MLPAKQNQKFPFHCFFRFAVEGWGEDLTGKLHLEAILSLQEEAVQRETTASALIGGSPYLIGLQLSEAEALPANSKSNINIMHKKINAECLGEQLATTIIYDLES